MTSDEQDRPGIRPTRRDVLRGGAVAGGLIWTAPVVQTLAPPAFAAGSPRTGSGFSYVAVLLQTAEGARYRIKWEISDAGTITGVETGRRWQAGYCAKQPGENEQTYFHRGDATVVDGSAPDGVIITQSADGRGFQLTLADGVDVVDWVVHQGQCCLRFSGSETPTSQSGPPGSNYSVTVSPGAPPGSGNTTYTWPAAPNKSPCHGDGVTEDQGAARGAGSAGAPDGQGRKSAKAETTSSTASSS